MEPHTNDKSRHLKSSLVETGQEPESPAKTIERKHSATSLSKDDFTSYTVTPEDSLTQIAYYHHMSVAYLKRINLLTSDVLYPGQTLKVLQRTDFTINKDIDEEIKTTPKNKPGSDSDSKILWNPQGEISDVNAIQDYLSKKYKTIVELHETYNSNNSKATESKDIAEKEDAEFVVVDLPLDYNEEDKERTIKVQKEKAIAKEIEKIENMEGGSYELPCYVLWGSENRVHGILELSAYFLSFEPTDDNPLITKNNLYYDVFMATIDLCQVEKVNCYSVPIGSETHYILHVIFRLCKATNMDIVLVTKSNKDIAPLKGETTSVCFDLGRNNKDMYYPIIKAFVKRINTAVASTKKSLLGKFQSTSMSERIFCTKNTPELIKNVIKGVEHYYIEENGNGLYQVYPQKTIAELKTKETSTIMTPHIKRYLRCIVPNVYQYKTWNLVFDPTHDGVSYSTLFYKAGDYNPTLVVIEDSKGNVFGIYASQVWNESKEFFGTGETFIFSFKVFFLKGKKCIAAGGGGEFAVRVGEEFSKGQCGICSTFENELLSDRNFTVKNFEVWGIEK